MNDSGPPKSRRQELRERAKRILFQNLQKEQGHNEQGCAVSTPQCLFLTFVVTALSVLSAALMTEVQRQNDDLRAVAITLPAPCAVARPRLSSMVGLLGGAKDAHGLTASVLCADTVASGSTAPLDVAASALAALYRGMLTNSSAGSVKRAICERTAGGEDSMVRISRAYLNSQSLMRAYQQRSTGTTCAWDEHPFATAEVCPNAAKLNSELSAHAQGQIAQALSDEMPDPVIALYRMLALSVLAESDRRHNHGKCLGNHERRSAEDLCAALWSNETASTAPSLPPQPGERGKFDRYYDEAYLDHCSNYGGEGGDPLASPPPPSPPSAAVVDDSHQAGRQQCVLLHTIGPWNVDYLFDLPDLRRHALPFGGDSFAKSVGGWLFKIVEDNLTNDLVERPQRAALLYALYRKAAFYVWFVPALYVLGWYIPCGILPLLFIALRPLSKACCPKIAESRLGKTLDDTPIVVPPFGTNRYLAAATAVLTLAYVLAVHPSPAEPVSTPTCTDSDGAVFATTDTDGVYLIVYGLVVTFAASFVFYAVFTEPSERAISEGPEKAGLRRSTVRTAALLVALVALPGAVVALVDSGKKTIETVRSGSYTLSEVGNKVEDFIDMSDVLVYTALFHGIAVGIWSNGWIVDHGSVAKKDAPAVLSCMRVIIPLMSALAAFAPRFKKYTSQRETWFPARSDLATIDLLAYAAEIGLAVVAVLAISQRLPLYPEKSNYQKTLLDEHNETAQWVDEGTAETPPLFLGTEQ